MEQTSNLGGGSIWSLERIAAVTGVARQHGLRTHLDGARLMNAVIAGGVPGNEIEHPLAYVRRAVLNQYLSGGRLRSAERPVADGWPSPIPAIAASPR